MENLFAFLLILLLTLVIGIITSEPNKKISFLENELMKIKNEFISFRLSIAMNKEVNHLTTIAVKKEDTRIECTQSRKLFKMYSPLPSLEAA